MFCFDSKYFFPYTQKKRADFLFSSHVFIKIVIWCVTVWHCWCRWSVESLADQHKWEHTQTVPGKHPAEGLRLFPAVLVLILSQTLIVSSCFLPVVSILVFSSITVTVADVAVPQQDSSWLCLRGLLLAHCYCGTINRQQVSVEKNCWRIQDYLLLLFWRHGTRVLAESTNNFTYEHCGF